MNSIESLDVDDLSLNKDVAWKEIILPNQGWSAVSLSPRQELLIAPFSQSEILILGGKNTNFKELGDAYILNTKSLALKKVLDSYFGQLKLYSNINNCYMVKPGKVVGFVFKEKYESNLVSYSRGDKKLKYISTKGVLIHIWWLKTSNFIYRFQEYKNASSKSNIHMWQL